MSKNNVLSFNKWTQTTNNQGIIGFKRKRANATCMDHRAELVALSSIEEIIEVLKDVPAYPKWMYNCTEAVLLEQNGEFNGTIYYVQSSKLDSAGRDIVLSVNTLIDLNRGKFITTLKSIKDHPYQHPDHESNLNRVRIEDFKGTWGLEALTKKSTKVTFTVHAEPGRAESKFFINSHMHKLCFNSLHNLKKMAKREKYVQAATLTSPQNKIVTSLYGVT
jgi:ribosome-associated toxin RatA of RatAB toxin-antitoxin module